MVEETGVPGENRHFTQSHWYLSHRPGRDSHPASGKRQRAFSGNALNDATIRTGPLVRVCTQSDDFGYCSSNRITIGKYLSRGIFKPSWNNNLSVIYFSKCCTVIKVCSCVPIHVNSSDVNELKLKRDLAVIAYLGHEVRMPLPRTSIIKSCDELWSHNLKQTLEMSREPCH